MIVYSIGIIDHWNGWQNPKRVFRAASKDTEDGRTWADWEKLWTEAQWLAGRLGWEGDVRQGPYVAVVPNRPDEFWECSVIIGWKQDNNGSTFIASERFALRWLDDCDMVRSGQ